MNPLEELHNKIDTENWDVKDIDLINKSFQDVNDKLVEFESDELFHKSEKEREVFSFSKSPDGISWRFQGTNTLKDGTKEPIEWPDIHTWSENDFSYILERFHSTKNIFARSEYGTFLYFNGKLDPAGCNLLFQDLFTLSKRYYQESRKDEKHLYYGIHFFNALSIALQIAHYKRKAPGFSDELSQALLFVEEVHKNWALTGKYLLRTTIDMTALIIQYYDYASEIINVSDFFERNNLAAEEQAKTYTWGGIYIIDENIQLAKYLEFETISLIKRKAELYEKLASERSKGDLAIATFLETSLRLYNQIGDAENVKRLEKRFQKTKIEGDFQKFGFELPSEEVQRIEKLVKQEIDEKEQKDILRNFALCPMYLPIGKIKENAEDWKQNAVMSFMSGSSISDKYGNTIARYPGNSEEWAFLQAYSFQFQLGTRTLVYFFLEAYKARKINYDGIIDYLKKTWLGQEISRTYNNQSVIVVPLEIVKDPIKILMKELDIWKQTQDYIPNIISVTDSLVLKIEALLRYFCSRLGIKTFRLRDDGLVMERNLDEILASLKHSEENQTNFQEEDRQFIKYILSEKAGENLRNKIAHGLMDSFEYSIDKTILAFTIIMRISNYTFKNLNQ